MSIRASVPPTFAPERAWVIDVLLRHVLGLAVEIHRDAAANVTLRLDGHVGEVRVDDGLFAGDDRNLLDEQSLPPSPVRWWDVWRDLPEAEVCGPTVPVLFGEPRHGAWATLDESRVRIAADLFGGAFVQLSRLEEAVLAEVDEHGRLPVTHALAYRNGFLDRPVVDEYGAILFAAMRRVWPGIDRPRRAYRLVLSHDVDLPFCRDGFGRRVAGDLVKRRDPRLAIRRAASRLRPARPSERSDVCCTFERLMDDAESVGTQAAFYFICGGHGSAINGDYRIDDPRVRIILQRIAERGHEIGVHPSYDTWTDLDALRREVTALRQVCEELDIQQDKWGGRQHYLRWRNPTTWQNWSDAGLDYDSTLSFAGVAGFRCGTCTPYPAFNVVTREALNLVEVPLVVMEGSLLDYQRLSGEQALETIGHLSRRCRDVGGDFTLLWHNHRLVTHSEAELWNRALEVAA